MLLSCHRRKVGLGCERMRRGGTGDWLCPGPWPPRAARQGTYAGLIQVPECHADTKIHQTLEHYASVCRKKKYTIAQCAGISCAPSREQPHQVRALARKTVQAAGSLYDAYKALRCRVCVYDSKWTRVGIGQKSTNCRFTRQVVGCARSSRSGAPCECSASQTRENAQSILHVLIHGVELVTVPCAPRGEPRRGCGIQCRIT